MNSRSGSGGHGLPGPVAVGGIGGSGTRVLFQLLEALGYYLGRDLNPAGDNLWFTILFKRPLWLCAALKDGPARIHRALEFFDKCMATGNRPSHEELSFYFRAVHEYYRQPYHKRDRFTPARLKNRMDKIKEPHEVNEKNYRGWGWKEPNSFIYLEYLGAFYPDLKYIHLVRHGLDMAYSSRAQYRYWSSFFGLDLRPDWDELPEPVKKVEYWLRANAFALEQGRRRLGDRFLVVRFDELCEKPEATIGCLLDFLGIDRQTIDTGELNIYDIPKAPASVGRYKNYNPDIFSTSQLDGVRGWGFETAWL
jgi:hypothetical protein